ncbi:hypothetical protein DAEQUDRAFT_68528 [Daedalea quercina L-15889]|uniref:Uncharacterized protein n=1 Tax=Daedalea quercina L-15889 TaxID=1314783 RepID=A0A165L6X2_9APHY|nr:hypothetical protein DAEQUDRAFT_68528 [Daedalea quercina L-15889]
MASISLSREPFSPDRAAPFSIQDFSDLVSSAFNLASPVQSSSRPCLSLQPDASLSLSQTAPGVPPSPTSSCFDADTDDDDPARSPRRASRSSAKEPMASEQSPKSRSAFRVLRRVRSRASAMLRQANTHLAPPSEGIDRSARPSVSSQRTLQSTITASSYAFLSRPPTPHGGSPFPELELSRTRSRAKSFTGQGPSSLLKLSKRDGGASSASASQAPGASAQADTEALPSFFETTGYAERNPQPPAYSRPGTPVLPMNAQAQPRIHTRLPPLRKAKSASTSLFRGKKAKGQATANDAAGAQPRIALDWTMLDSEEYFTSPRHPPPVPPLPKIAQASRSPDSGADEEGDLVVPAYVFERRGSATSTCTTSTTASSKSTSSLSERIASVFQSKAKLRARSKLSLAITTATADSSPSTDSTRTWSPVTPTGGFAFPSASAGLGLVYSQSEQGHGTVYEEDASKIGRVLTPEPDPFAKADVAVARFSTDVTPRAVSPSVKYGSRRGSRQDDRRTRKARSTQQGWDFKDASPEIAPDDEDVSLVYSRARGGPSVGRGRIPEFTPESPSPKSPVYEFPSSCSIYPAGGMGAFQSPLLAGPAARTRANLVSRFSMSTDSLCSRSTFTDSAEHQGLKDVDVDATFVFGSPMLDANVDDAIVRDIAPRSPGKRATLGVCASPKAEKSAIARSSTRASLPSSPRSARGARYAQRVECVPDATTRRQASVRTSASEPPPRAQRPSSPFPLVRGVSDGSQKARPGLHADGKAGTGCPSGDVSVNDSGMYCGIVMQEETQYAETFEDSFVLSGEEMEHLQIPVSPLPSPDLHRFAQECRAFDTDEDALTPRPISPARSFLSANVLPIEDTDRTVTVGSAACEWDRRTTEPSECSTGSSTFFSARSSVESARRSV